MEREALVDARPLNVEHRAGESEAEDAQQDAGEMKDQHKSSIIEMNFKLLERELSRHRTEIKINA